MPTPPPRPTPSLAERVAQRLGLAAQEAQRLVATVGETVADVLASEAACDLPGLGRLLRRELPAHGPRAPSSEIVLEPTESLAQRLDQARGRTILSVLAEDDPLAAVLEQHVLRHGWRARRSTDLETATELDARGALALVVCDMRLPDATRLLERIKLRTETPTPFLALYPPGADPLRHAGFTLLADEHLIEPFEIARLLEGVDRLLAARSGASGAAERTRRLRWVFTTTEEHLARAAELARLLLERSGLERDARVAFAAAFREAIANAAEHGNRDDPRRRVHVQFLQDHRRVQFTVRDEGAGFDHARATAASEQGGDPVRASTEHRRRSPRGRQGGLGLLLMQRCCDRVVFNDAGNEVTLLKRT